MPITLHKQKQRQRFVQDLLAPSFRDIKLPTAPTHIDQLIAMGPAICHHLWDLCFTFADIDNPQYSASNLTPAAVARLAQACPNLRHVQLQGADNLTDHALTALFEHCPDLRVVELTTTPGRNVTIPMKGTAFNALRKRPGWVPGLKKLHVPEIKGMKYMRAMRDLGKKREGLLIQLVSVGKDKEKWRDGGIGFLRSILRIT